MTGIYKITNKINNKSYIGQSIHIEERFKEHISKPGKIQSLIHCAIVKYGLTNFDFSVLEECAQSQLNEREIYWIDYYNTFENGYNLTRGGQSGFVFDIEKIYQTFLKCENLAETARQIGCSISTVRRVIREYGINKSECQADCPVEQINPQTLEVIKVYDTIADAADAIGVHRNAISMAISGIHNSSGGYYWRKVNDLTRVFNPTKEVKRQKRQIKQLDKQTKQLINVFPSAAEAAAHLGKDRKNGGSQIIAVCKGRKKSAFNYIWEYAD